MRKAAAVHQTAQVVFGVERIRPGAGNTPAERAVNGEVIESLEFPNLVLDVGLDALYSNTMVDMMDTCHVGTGTAEPATTDEGLANELTSTANTSSDTSGGNASPLYSSHTVVFVFGEGQAQGNLTEVGLSNGDSTPVFFNRQLFRDGNGDPVTVTIGSDEVLRITAEGRWYSDIQTAESTSNDFTFKSTTITATRTTTESNRFTGGQLCRRRFNFLKVDLNGKNPDAVSNGGYTSGTYTITYTLIWNAGTLGGSYDTLAYGGYPLNDGIRFYEFGLSPALDVDSTEELTMTVTLTWGRMP